MSLDDWSRFNEAALTMQLMLDPSRLDLILHDSLPDHKTRDEQQSGGRTERGEAVHQLRDR